MSEPMENSECEHKQTMIANDYMAEWCEDCGAARFRNNGKLDGWILPKRHAERSQPTINWPSFIKKETGFDKHGYVATEYYNGFNAGILSCRRDA